MSNLGVSLLSLVEAVISAAESMEGERLETTCETSHRILAAAERLSGTQTGQ